MIVVGCRPPSHRSRLWRRTCPPGKFCRIRRLIYSMQVQARDHSRNGCRFPSQVRIEGRAGLEIGSWKLVGMQVPHRAVICPGFIVHISALRSFFLAERYVSNPLTFDIRSRKTPYQAQQRLLQMLGVYRRECSESRPVTAIRPSHEAGDDDLPC